MAREAFAWFAGVDWGSERHHACIVDAEGFIAGEREFPHSGAGLAALGDWLLLIAGEACAVAVAIEVPHGPVVDSLIDRGFALYAITQATRPSTRPVQRRRCQRRSPRRLRRCRRRTDGSTSVSPPPSG
jgi:Transposase